MSNKDFDGYIAEPTWCDGRIIRKEGLYDGAAGVLTLLLGRDSKFYNQSQSSEIDRPLVRLQVK